MDTFINIQGENDAMTDTDKKIYRYGYILLFEVLLNLMIALGIGIFFSKMQAVLFFLGAYIPLRSFCGGWHADEIWKCTIISNVILLLQIFCIENIIEYLSIAQMMAIYFFNIFFILLMAPVETESKKISQDERQHYKRKIKFFIGIHLMIMVMLIRWGVKEYIFSMMFVYFVQNMMLLMEMVKKSKWVLKNE